MAAKKNDSVLYKQPIETSLLYHNCTPPDTVSRNKKYSQYQIIDPSHWPTDSTNGILSALCPSGYISGISAVDPHLRTLCSVQVDTMMVILCVHSTGTFNVTKCFFISISELLRGFYSEFNDSCLVPFRIMIQ